MIELRNDSLSSHQWFSLSPPVHCAIGQSSTSWCYNKFEQEQVHYSASPTPCPPLISAEKKTNIFGTVRLSDVIIS